MSQAMLKSHPFITSLCCAVLLFAVVLGVFTQAQNKKTEKPVQLSDAVERLGPNQIRAKPGFRLVLVDEGWIVEQVNGKEVRRLEARVKCGTCPGGSCRSRLNGSCVPRNSCTSQGCLIDPF